MADTRIVVVTGASAGIGRATAKAFARQGARVALLARGTEGLEGARRDVTDLGGEAMVIPTDVADFEQVAAAADRVERAWGPIDVWVNNAMATILCPLVDITPKDYKRATEVTYLGAVWGTMAALRSMKPRNRGSIVQVGSALAYRSIPLQSAYCGAKSAMRAFTDSLRSELLHDNSNIHLTMVQLSAFNTPQFDWARTTLDKQPQPLPPIFEPEVAAEAIVWAADNRRREMWVGFPAVKTILGQRIAPPLLDRLLAKEGYAGQQADEPLPPGRRDNLHEPVPGDHGARGRFSDQTKATSRQLWFAMRPWATISLFVLVVVVTLVLAIMMLRWIS